MRTILLAAGLSSRMCRQKLLMPFGGRTVVETVLENLYKAGLAPVCAVLSAELAEKIKDRPGLLETAVNHAPERGQSSSLAIGLAMLPRGSDFCVMLGDLPGAAPEGMAALYEKFKNRPKRSTVLAPLRDGAFGHPMFYASVWKERFAGAEGDQGGREILRRYRDEIITVEADEGHFRDIDTPEDYERARRQAAGSRDMTKKTAETCRSQAR